MKRETNYYAFESFFLPLLFVFLLINTLYRSEYESLFPLGDFTTTISIIGMCLILVKSISDKATYQESLLPVQLSIGLMMAIYLTSYFTYYKLDVLLISRLMLFFLFILGSIRMKWNKQHLKMAGYIFSGAIILIFSHWLVSGFPLSGFKSIFRNENYLGVLLFCFLYFNIVSINYSKGKEQLYFVAILLLNLILIIPTSARSVVIAMFVILMSWIILKSFRNHFSKLFYIVMTGNFLFLIGYVGLSHTAIGAKLNDISFSLTGKNLFSGRHEIWNGVIRALVEKPLFGFGIGTHAPDIADTSSRAHNMYLQVVIETGLIGLAAFMFVLWAIWRLLNKRLNNTAAAKWSACFMLGILVYNEFEFTMMSNNYSIALFQWLIITIGINFVGREQLDTRRSG